MDCASWADRLVRTDLINGYIVSENDYTSNLTGALRREIDARRVDGLRASAGLESVATREKFLTIIPFQVSDDGVLASGLPLGGGGE
jgi:hypothetical protein